MAFGLGRLRLSPADFWSMTPRELAAAMTPFKRAAPTPVARASLEALMREFPDRERCDG